MLHDILSEKPQRVGVLVDPYTRLTRNQLQLIHQASLDILTNIGIVSLNRHINELLAEHGAEISTHNGETIVKFPAKLVEHCIEMAPSQVVLGARNPANRLILDADEARVRFGTGSETNVWLDVERSGNGESAGCSFVQRRGTLERLCKSARLCDHLDSVDFFIRNVNIQDDDINDESKDVNIFFASLSNITKHVMAGINKVERLPDVLRMAEIIAGGKEAFAENPIISMITCVIKSPLQLVDETADKLMAIARLGIPVVISSSPQGGATGPIDEGDMVAMINAEILAGITIAQLVRPGTPVLYGAVPARANMNTLHNMYGAPETNQYNIDCVQMARFYRIPCYSTAGVSDAAAPGIQATMEKMFSHLSVTMSGPQYLHYAFGLLDKTNIFCPTQAVLDDAHVAAVKHFCRAPDISDQSLKTGCNQLQQVMNSSHKLFARFARKGMRTGRVFRTYPFEADDNADATLLKADDRAQELMKQPSASIPKEKVDEIFKAIPDILPRLKPGADD
jgi:trimethylamine--corrinoid protein Co-methyltransferase